MPKQEDKERYAKMWEEAESELGDDFDRFLGYIRTILLKDKARLSLVQEFEDKIYEPKERDKCPPLEKGQKTFETVENYLNHYRTLVGGGNHGKTGSFEFDNLIKVMLYGLPATDWLPPLLRYFDRLEYDRLLEFLKKLNNKLSADWICRFTPTERINAMNEIIRVIDSAICTDDIVKSSCFSIDVKSFIQALDQPIYTKRFDRYILLMLDYLYHNHKHPMQFETLSVEHILPQEPDAKSQWVTDFTAEERKEWTDKLGNLVLITRRKNSSQGRLDYDLK